MIEEGMIGGWKDHDDDVLRAVSKTALVEWLASRESDIAAGIEDLGELRPVFLDLFGFPPRDDA